MREGEREGGREGERERGREGEHNYYASVNYTQNMNIAQLQLHTMMV